MKVIAINNNQKQQKMRKAEFIVPQEAVVEFCQELTEHSLTNEIKAVTEDDELVIEVSYEREETKEIDELEAHLASLCEEMEEEK